MRSWVFLNMKQNFQTENYFCCLHSLIVMNLLTSTSTLNFHPGLSHTVNASFFPPKSRSQFTENQMEHIKNLSKHFFNRYCKTNAKMNRLKYFYKYYFKYFYTLLTQICFQMELKVMRTLKNQRSQIMRKLCLLGLQINQIKVCFTITLKNRQEGTFSIIVNYYKEQLRVLNS